MRNIFLSHVSPLLPDLIGLKSVNISCIAFERHVKSFNKEICFQCFLLKRGRESIVLKLDSKLFHSSVAPYENCLSPYVTVLVDGSLRRFPELERRFLAGTYNFKSSRMYGGAGQLQTPSSVK